MVIQNAVISQCEDGIYVTGENIVIENQFITKCDVGIVMIPIQE